MLAPRARGHGHLRSSACVAALADARRRRARRRRRPPRRAAAERRSGRRSPCATSRCRARRCTRRGTRPSRCGGRPSQRATGAVDVVHATAVAVPPRGGARSSMTVHDLAFLADPAAFTRHGLRFFRRGTELARRHAGSSSCRRRRRPTECRAAGFDADRLRVVPWGHDAAPVPAEDGRPPSATASACPSATSCSSAPLEPRKNLPRLVEAWARWPAPTCRSCWPARPGGATRADRRGRAVPRLGFVEPDVPRRALRRGGRRRLPEPARGLRPARCSRPWPRARRCVTSTGTATEEVAGDAAVLVDPLDVRVHRRRPRRAPRRRRPAARDLGARARARAATFTWTACADGYARRLPATVGERDLMRVGVNLLWLVPGDVGGCETLDDRAARPPRRPTGPTPRSWSSPPPAVLDAHPWLDAFEVVRAPARSARRGRCGSPPSRRGCRWRPARAQVDVLHHPGGTLPPVRAGPAVLTIHDLQPLAMPEHFSPPKRAYLQAPPRPVGPRRPPRHRRQRVHPRRRRGPPRGRPDDRIVVTPPAVDPDPAPPAVDVDDGRAPRYRLDRPWFLYPAITYPHKDHAVARAVPSPTVPDALLVLTGGAGPEEPRAAGAGRAARRRRPRPPPGPRAPDAPRRVSTVARWPAPSRRASRRVGLPVLEAMARGCPVLAADATGAAGGRRRRRRPRRPRRRGGVGGGDDSVCSTTTAAAASSLAAGRARVAGVGAGGVGGPARRRLASRAASEPMRTSSSSARTSRPTSPPPAR